MSNIAKSQAVNLKTLHAEPWFQNWIKEVEKSMPPIPTYNPGDQKHNAETWAYWSGMKEGYKLAISHIGVNLHE